ncbi:zinc finger protein 2-like [Cimex lectularius]|uniref:C2H2-type domain-containing protein n=1 Tax=Cimex lectularius TaxID=79782 RepID=A0A8I6SHZ8_CIMLE|nr:zinc finger protein 2-like [Cimex lectularius]
MTERRYRRTDMAEYCFVCGNKLLGFSALMTATATSHLGVDIPVKIGQVVGNDFFIIVSNEDKICKHCLNLINELDEFENNVIIARKKVFNLLAKKYSIHDVSDTRCNYNLRYNHFEQNPSIDAPSHKFDISTAKILKDDPRSKDNRLSNYDGSFDEKKSLENCTLDSRNLFASTHNNIKPEQNQNTFHERTDVSLSIEIVEASKESSLVYKNENTVDTKSKVTNSIHSQDFQKNESISDCFLGKEGQKNQAVEGVLQTKITTKNSQFDSVNEFCSGIKTEQNENNQLAQIDKKIVPPDLSDSVQCNLTNKEIDLKHCTNNKESLKDKQYKCFSRENVFCSLCKIQFENINSFFKHKQINMQCSQKNTCTLCKVQCMHNHHNLQCENLTLSKATKEYYICSICDIRFDTSKALRSHQVKSHQTKQNFGCRICSKIFKKQIQLDNHVKYFHGSRKCKICGKYIEDEVKLRQHVQRHIRLDSKKLDCDVCGRNFKTPSGLRVHKVSHTGNYKFFCEFCGRGFMSAVIMDEHKGVHTKEEKYMCDMCGRKFVHYSTFHLHKQWHRDPFPFPCKICDKKFKYRSERSNHVRRDHTGDYPYKCDCCQAKFLKLVYLKRHMINHTHKYPHTCEMCNKGFDQKRSLARHLACIHKDNSLLNTPKQCQYKIILRPEEYDFTRNK